MEGFFKIINGVLMCSKTNHDLPIFMIAIDESVPIQERFLCSKCFQQKREISKQIISLDQAKDLIFEQLKQSNSQNEVSNEQVINNLQAFLQKIHNHKSKFLSVIDSIIKLTESWIENIQKYQTRMNYPSLIEALVVKKLDKKIQENINNLENNNQSYFKKIETSVQSLIKMNAEPIFKDLLAFISSPSPNKEKCEKKFLSSINLVQSIQQQDYCFALSFNNEGSIMISGLNSDIKVWGFNQKIMAQNQILKGHSEFVYCFAFSKKRNWFASGSYDQTIRCWKQQSDNDWVSSMPGLQHKLYITCLIINNDESSLISSGGDSIINVWRINYDSNEIEFNYSLEQKHSQSVNCLSLNEKEDAFVSCSDDKQIIIWTKNEKNKWIYQNHIKMKEIGYRICFLEENLIAWQSNCMGITNILQYKKDQILLQPELNIKLKTAQNDCQLSQTVYIQQRELLVQKHNHFIYFIQKQIDGQFKIFKDPMNNNHINNFFALTRDGEFLVVWSEGTKKIDVYNMIYK